VIILNRKTEKLATLLKERKIKPSYQRMKIFEYLTEMRNHPTVDTIYRDLVGEIPTLSKATVYNTLDQLKKNGLARVVTIEDNITRYDSQVSAHGHFKCVSCGRIIDFPVEMEAISTHVLENCTITDKNVYFKGICPGCRNGNQ